MTDVFSDPMVPLALCGAVLAGIIIFWKPLKLLFRILLRSAVGAAALALFAPLGQHLGLSLGVNLFNALVLGVLGLPGLGLLFTLRYLLLLPG